MIAIKNRNWVLRTLSGYPSYVRDFFETYCIRGLEINNVQCSRQGIIPRLSINYNFFNSQKVRIDFFILLLYLSQYQDQRSIIIESEPQKNL